ncbi:hypothetical protein [Rhizobium bangladeshense]|uniref:hypothetical protein n=1 Tax=Rhizobium bangladeshense TaxID=1138189 RepID=UPI0007E53E2A|nr:hypothetical protein [Rhizobium bangladeshense]
MAEAEIPSPVLDALLDIMTSDDIPEARCIDAAKAIIEYESPPEVFAIVHAYLMGVAQDAGQPVELKLKALELIRKVEARRVVPGTSKAIDTAQAMALGNRVAIAKRRIELVRKEAWPAQKGWADNLGEVRGIVVEEEGIAERLEAARLKA